MSMEYFDPLDDLLALENLSPLLFSSTDIALLRKHLKHYNAIVSGNLPTASAKRLHFLEASRGEAQPRTAHEVAYLKYCAWCCLVEKFRKERDARDQEASRVASETTERRIAEGNRLETLKISRMKKPRPKPSPTTAALARQILAEHEKQTRE